MSAQDLEKWQEIVRTGVGEYMRSHPDKFRRRIRRGIPRQYRWEVWKAVVDFSNHSHPNDYVELSKRENRWTDQIEMDVSRTFTDNKSFDNGQQQRLLRVLNAYAANNPQVGYCQGMNYVAALLLLISDSEEECFCVFECLMERHGLAGFYTNRLPLLRQYLHACDTLLKEMVPDLHAHFSKEDVQPAVYLHQWFLTLFINCFPLSMVMIIWDMIVFEGLPFVLRIAISILQVLKDSLLTMHFEEIIGFFKKLKRYDCEADQGVNAFRIGQLLVKHTEHVHIPEHILASIKNFKGLPDGEELTRSESLERFVQESGEDAEVNSWLNWHTFTRLWSTPSNTTRSSWHRSSSDYDLASRASSNATTPLRGAASASMPCIANGPLGPEDDDDEGDELAQTRNPHGERRLAGSSSHDIADSIPHGQLPGNGVAQGDKPTPQPSPLPSPQGASHRYRHMDGMVEHQPLTGDWTLL